MPVTTVASNLEIVSPACTVTQEGRELNKRRLSENLIFCLFWAMIIVCCGGLLNWRLTDPGRERKDPNIVWVGLKAPSDYDRMRLVALLREAGNQHVDGWITDQDQVKVFVVKRTETYEIKPEAYDHVVEDSPQRILVYDILVNDHPVQARFRGDIIDADPVDVTEFKALVAAEVAKATKAHTQP